MQPFSYQSPTSISEAASLLAQAGAKALAGGTDLIPQLREGRRQAGHVVDLKLIPELTATGVLDDGALAIGAAVTATAVARHEVVRSRYPALAQAAGMIGSLQVQNRATLGGNVCNAAPSADAVPPLMVLEAVAIIAGADGERRVPLESLFAGPGRTSLATDELLVAIELAKPRSRSASHYMRFTPRREMDIAVVGVAASITCDAQGVISTARVALASVAPTPIRSASAEALLAGQMLDADIVAAAANAAVDDARPISDTRGSADYRRELVSVLTRRVLARCRDDLATGST
jgi:CO/xanthine dehydrogenase FAD-binding subunit